MQNNNDSTEGLLGVSLKRLLSFGSMTKEELGNINQKSSLDMKLVVYLSAVIGAQNMMAEKLNKLT
jgi:hypothetical protein